MISKAAILERASEWQLTPGVVEKDYVLGWLLAGIALGSDLGTTWVFKGGTCLKKCVLETYRFSEDLDFTLLPDAVYSVCSATSCRPRRPSRTSSRGCLRQSGGWMKPRRVERRRLRDYRL